MKPVIGLATSWFGHFRWREFALAMGAVYAGVMQTCQQIGIPEEKSARLAVIVTGGAAVLYWLNPKSLDWAVPEKEASPAALGPGGIRPNAEKIAGKVIDKIEEAL